MSLFIYIYISIIYIYLSTYLSAYLSPVSQKIYYKESAHMIMEAEESHDPQSAS